jgi:predicted MFS family arabinose efflux permease
MNHAISDPETLTPPSTVAHWGGVAALSMCVAMLIAAEFMPVSLLTPIARDLGATEGQAGLAISISGLFAVFASLLIARLSAHLDRRHVLIGLTLLMLLSLCLIAISPSFWLLMVSRALLGIVIGGFWALATATVMRLVDSASVPKALGLMYMGNALATAFAAPLGSYLGGIIGWRGVFWLLTPAVLVNIFWLWRGLPSMPAQPAKTTSSIWGLLQRRHVVFAMLGVMLTFAGAFAAFTYLRPFLEMRSHVSVPQLSALLLGLGLAGFVGTPLASALLGLHLYRLLRWLPLALAGVTLALLLVERQLWGVAIAMTLWGAINAAIPVGWSAWIADGIRDAPESGGGLMVAAIQLSIMLGAALGGILLDLISVEATFIASALLLSTATLIIGNGTRLRPTSLITQE